MMVSSYPWWWLALPVLLLPVWWHRQKRQRLKAEPLATARFLPSAPPEQLRVWQWRDKVLLLVRCLLLIVLIAWLAATIFPLRGDTVLVDAGADKAWAERQIAAAGFGAATRIDMPADALQWLRANEREWADEARFLIVARAERIAMPARVPSFGHQVELRTQPSATSAAAAPAVSHVTLAVAEGRAQPWQALFAAFDTVGTRHQLHTTPDAATTLIVWDQPNAAPPADWRAADWWIAASPAERAARPTGQPPAAASTTPGRDAAFPELANAAALTINGITLRYADTPRGRLWSSDAFPPRDAATARALYETWRQLAAAPAQSYATPSQTFTAARVPLPAIAAARPAAWLAFALMALFIIERILTHARRN